MPRSKVPVSTSTGNQMSVPPLSNEPEWIKRMHAHFARTGQYRSEDIKRVLGDQRTQVSPRESVESLAFASKIKIAG